jgi:hypothetical protein
MSSVCKESSKDSELYRAGGMAPQRAAPPGAFVGFAILKKNTDALFRKVMAILRLPFHYSRLLIYFNR